jgi:hypothetical protein
MSAEEGGGGRGSAGAPRLLSSGRQGEDEELDEEEDEELDEEEEGGSRRKEAFAHGRESTSSRLSIQCQLMFPRLNPILNRASVARALKSIAIIIFVFGSFMRGAPRAAVASPRLVSLRLASPRLASPRLVHQCIYRAVARTNLQEHFSRAYKCRQRGFNIRCI